MRMLCRRALTRPPRRGGLRPLVKALVKGEERQPLLQQLRRQSGGLARRPRLPRRRVPRMRPQRGRRLRRLMPLLMGAEMLLTNRALRESSPAMEAGHLAAQQAAATTKPQQVARQGSRTPMQEVIMRQDKELGVLRGSLGRGTIAVSAATLTAWTSCSRRNKVNLGAQRAVTFPCKASTTSTP